MKMKSISGIVCYVRDLATTIEFYRTLGFEFKELEQDHARAYLNWFWIDFVPQNNATGVFEQDAKSERKGDGVYIYINVEDVDEAYHDVLSKGLKPSYEPRNWPWGNREFVLRDPDGYKLVFFNKIKK